MDDETVDDRRALRNRNMRLPRRNIGGDAGIISGEKLKGESVSNFSRRANGALGEDRARRPPFAGTAIAGLIFKLRVNPSRPET